MAEAYDWMLDSGERDFDEPAPPAPPSAEEEELNYRLFELVKNLNHAADEYNMPWALYFSVRLLISCAGDRKGLRPGPEDRDQMLEAAARARVGAMNNLGHRYPPEQIDIAMDAVCGLIVHWAASDQERLARDRDFTADMFAYATMFRRDLDNALTLDEIKERSRKRRASQSAALGGASKVEVLR